MGVLRVGGILGGASFVWVVMASQVPSHMRLPLDGVVAGARITQPFGCTDLQLEPFALYCPGHHIHTGIDLAAPAGTEVYSATAGVANIGYDPSAAGLYVVVRLDAHVRLLYCHLSAFRVRPGEYVTAGQVIGAVGATGLTTGPHVHFEVQVDGRSVDPAGWLGS